MPMQVGIREAKATLSALVGRARRGDTITITDHGRPVARLVPMPDSERSLEERLAQLEERGLISSRPATDLGSPPPPVDLSPENLLQDLLQEDRNGG